MIYNVNRRYKTTDWERGDNKYVSSEPGKQLLADQSQALFEAVVLKAQIEY